MNIESSDTRVVLVVGGARGIGLAVGELLSRRHWQVVLADLDTPAAAIEQRFDCRTVDVTDRTSVDQLASALHDRYGHLDGLVNAAGYNRHAAAAELPDRIWIDLVDVHLGGVLRVCRAFYGSLKLTSRASVVNFSSIGARVGRPGRAPYAAAKAGVEALTRTLAIEWSSDGIRVNAVVPGIINTRLVQENISKGLVDEESLKRGIPLRRFGEPTEVAEAVAYLVSDRASYITGQTLVVDGGALANGNW